MTLDDALTTLAHPSRRKIAMQLRDELVTPDGGVSPAGDTTESGHVAVDTNSIEGVSLYHTHLPMLEAAGFVTWNRETGTVHRGPGFSEMLPLLQAIDDYAATLPTDAA